MPQQFVGGHVLTIQLHVIIVPLGELVTVRHRKLLVLLVLGACAALACESGLAPFSPAPPGGTIQASGAAADELESNIRNQLFNPARKTFQISITNQQATSYATLRNTRLPLEKPQIWFSQGKAYVRGTFTAICLFHPDVLIVAAPSVKDKQLVVNVLQIYAGTFGLPHDWLATVSKSVTDSITDAQMNLDFERVDVLEGELVITGSKRVH
jgi:hypothetical protein